MSKSVRLSLNIDRTTLNSSCMVDFVDLVDLIESPRFSGTICRVSVCTGGSGGGGGAGVSSSSSVRWVF